MPRGVIPNPVTPDCSCPGFLLKARGNDEDALRQISAIGPQIDGQALATRPIVLVVERLRFKLGGVLWRLLRPFSP
jgi:hypothetical protein